jgi:hypothetical protein
MSIDTRKMNFVEALFQMNAGKFVTRVHEEKEQDMVYEYTRLRNMYLMYCFDEGTVTHVSPAQFNSADILGTWVVVNC